MSLVEDLKWRGLVHDATPDIEKVLDGGSTSIYIGIDPTADSLHIGSLVSVMMLRRLADAGHTPIALIGGATGMIGDPSGKSQERNLLTSEVLENNAKAIEIQLSKYLSFGKGKGEARLVNNYDWTKSLSVIDFLRDVGKYITVSYMLAKESVQRRLETGISYTEFSYQLVQGYDFYWLSQNMDCNIQMGGSDQWGNMITGTELIRRKSGKDAYCLTWPLVTKSDGGKFGKTETGNIWLDPKRTSPYAFYQFWLNASDEDAGKFLKIFTLLPKDEILDAQKEHLEAPHLRGLQKLLAQTVTTFIHGEEELKSAQMATEVLFGKNNTPEGLIGLSKQSLLDALEGVDHFKLDHETFHDGTKVVNLLVETCSVLPSRGEARKLIANGGLSINRNKVTDPEATILKKDLLHDSLLLVQKGKKGYTLIELV